MTTQNLRCGFRRQFLTRRYDLKIFTPGVPSFLCGRFSTTSRASSTTMVEDNGAQISEEIQDQISDTPTSTEATSDAPISSQIATPNDQNLLACEASQDAALVQFQNMHLEGGPQQIRQVQPPSNGGSAATNEKKRAQHSGKTSPQKRPRFPSISSDEGSRID